MSKTVIEELERRPLTTIFYIEINFPITERKLDALMLLIRYLNMAGIRIIDLFRMLDSDSHAKVTKDSFICGLKVRLAKRLQLPTTILTILVKLCFI